MISAGKIRPHSSWSTKDKPVAENFWVSFSDLMAGLLMIFALTMSITLLDIGKRLIEPAKVVRDWEKVIHDICHDSQLRNIENVEVDCNTGALVISDQHLRFGFAETELGEEAEQLLRQAVPKYFEIINRYPDFVKRIDIIEISGHTDKVDTLKMNPQISRERAGKVYSFLLDEPAMNTYRELFKKKAITAGYTDILFPEDCTDEKCDKARRVEIKIKLQEKDVLRDFLRILKQVIR
ncbi:MAG: OmpA family protein [Proteobacteria bacterium]|nr:OmpA family protein [Pseudomonadota bacterium]